MSMNLFEILLTYFKTNGKIYQQAEMKKIVVSVWFKKVKGADF
jgi:hypothetical protein